MSVVRMAETPTWVLVDMCIRKHLRELERDIAHAVYGEEWRRYITLPFFDPELTEFERGVRDAILKRLQDAAPSQD